LKNYSSKNSFGAQLAVMFCACFVIRLILALTLHTNATITIDENLYPNIARSLADSFTPAYRAQGVSYPYLLYPLLLVPVYRLQRLFGGDLFRWVQVFGTAVMTSGVIPAGLLGRRVTGSTKKALICAGLTALMPDMVLGGCEMSECVIWALAMWLMYTSVIMLEGGKPKYAYLSAIITALMFFAKPGAVVMGGVMLFIALILRIKEKQGVLHAIGAVLTLAVGIGLVYALYYGVFGADSSLMGLYDFQTADLSAKDIPLIIEAFALSEFLSVFALMGVFAVLPLMNLNSMSKPVRAFVVGLAAGITLINLGTAVFVVPSMYKDGAGLNIPLHLRYCVMFLPGFIAPALSLDSDKLIHKKGTLIALIIVAVLAVFPGARAGFIEGHGSGIDSCVLSAFSAWGDFNYTVTGIIATALVLGVIAFVCIRLRGGKGFINLALCAFAAFLIFNNVYACRLSVDDADEGIIADAMEINAVLNERDGNCLGVTLNDYHDGYIYWLESRLNRPMQQVSTDSFFEQLTKNGGVYQPYVPDTYRPISECGETIDTQTLILGKGVLTSMELSEGVQSAVTQNGHFAVVDFTRGERLCDTAISGLENTIIGSRSTATLHIYDESRNEDGILHLTIRLSGESDGAVLTVASAGKSAKLELTRQSQTYSITLPWSDTVTLKTGDERVAVRSYSTGG